MTEIHEEFQNVRRKIGKAKTSDDWEEITQHRRDLRAKYLKVTEEPCISPKLLRLSALIICVMFLITALKFFI